MLEQSQIEDFQKNGAVLLKGVFADFVETAREAIEENMQNPSWRERTYRPDDGGQAFFQDYVVWDQFDGYRALVRDSAMPELAAKLMQSKTARVFHDHILVKEPGNSVVTPWHQDQPYYLCEGRQSVSFWVPLDPIPRERTIEYIAGSHRWGKDFKPQRFDGTDLFEGDTSEAVPDVDNLRDELDILAFDVHEFFGAKVRTKSRLGHNIIGQFQRSLCRDDRVTAMCNIRKWTTMDECRIVFQCLHKVWLHRILQQHSHRAICLDIAAEDWAAITAVCNNHITQTFL